jgi:hypothetical protein
VPLACRGREEERKGKGFSAENGAAVTETGVRSLESSPCGIIYISPSGPLRQQNHNEVEADSFP